MRIEHKQYRLIVFSVKLCWTHSEKWLKIKSSRWQASGVLGSALGVCLLPFSPVGRYALWEWIVRKSLPPPTAMAIFHWSPVQFDLAWSSWRSRAHIPDTHTAAAAADTSNAKMRVNKWMALWLYGRLREKNKQREARDVIVIVRCARIGMCGLQNVQKTSTVTTEGGGRTTMTS